MKQGVWSQEEHDRFLAGVKIYPDGPWRLIARYVGTRSVRQVQTHAQKYHEKIARRMRGLRKERRNHVREEHRIDGDIFAMRTTATVTFEPPMHAYQIPSFHLPHEHRAYVESHGKLPSVLLPPLRLPAPVMVQEETPDVLPFDFFAHSMSSTDRASAVV